VVGTCHNQPLSHRITANQNRKRHMSCAYMNNMLTKFGEPAYSGIQLAGMRTFVS
jgi:hypothetical protein